MDAPTGRGGRLPGCRPFRAALVACLAVAGCSDDPTAPEIPGVLGEGAAGRWVTASPSSQGLDEAVLIEMGEEMDVGTFGEMSSLLVLRNGRLVYERYEDGWTPGDLHRVYSVTKSVTSLLIGISLAAGTLPGTATPAIDLLPHYDSIQNWSSQKEEITLAHVLEMRTGFEWDELATNYVNEINPVAALVASPDWIRHVLDLPMAAAPGTRFAYNSGVSVLMGGILARGTGRPVDDFAASNLFGPLGIEGWSWDRGSSDIVNTGWGLRLRPRDMAAIGQLVLDEGTWEGISVVPPDWVAESALPRTEFTDGTGYGYQWWIGRGGEERAVVAWGYGGQYIIVLPTLDLVMVSTAENYLGGAVNPYTLAEYGYRTAGAPVP
ncbi:MAG: serine hydrolase [Gemmatimonadetes bacterium]|nr:serine hydrolase [Gemmatimonadota bacterium]